MGRLPIELVRLSIISEELQSSISTFCVTIVRHARSGAVALIDHVDLSVRLPENTPIAVIE
jgi:hypothetical protein